MKKIFIIPLIGLFASCKTIQTSTLSTPMYAPKAQINPIRADVDVDMNKVLTGESEASYFLIFRVSGDKKYAEGLNISGSPIVPNFFTSLKSAAAYKAISNGNADVIVHPNFVLEKRNFIFFSNVKMKVTGYAGKFKKFYQVPYTENNKKLDLKLDVKSDN
jgi:hypothetical protein